MIKINKERNKSIMLTLLLSMMIVLNAITTNVVAQVLPHVTSWIGNTGNTGGDGVGISGSKVRGRLQNQIGSIAVTSGGVVFAAGEWDEGHIFLGAYQNGALIANFPGLWGWYIDGASIATNGTYTFVSVDWKSIKKYNTSKLSNIYVVGKDLTVSTGEVTGMVIVGNELFLSDNAGGKIKVYNIETMAFVREFAFANPGSITYDGTYLWITDLVNKQVEKYSTSGTYQMQIQLASSVIIDDIAFGNNKIYVADQSVDNNVKIFNTDGSSAGTFGTSLFSGIRGAYEPGKFACLSGIDLDANGNIYISTDFEQSPPYFRDKPRGGYTNIESFNPSGTTQNWAMYDWSFIEVAVPDPDDENILYTGRHYYEMDYSKPIGQEVVGKGVTFDHNLYTTDTRATWDCYTVMDMKKIGGNKYLFCTGMYGGGVDVYKFKGGSDGKIASFATSVDAGLNDVWGMTVDNAGNMWFCGYDNGIKKYTYNGLDGNGNPIWTNATKIAMPAPFKGIRRLEYDSDKDEMYIWGYTSDFPNELNTWGKGAGRRMARYNNWSTGNRTAAWVAGDLLYNKITGVEHGDSFIASADIAGDYIFCQYSHQTWYLNNGGNTPNAQYLEVYNKSDGSKVGYMQPSPDADLGWAQIDMPYGMRATKRSNGEYNIFVEDDWFHKVIMYKWTPSGSAANITLSLNLTAPLNNALYTAPSNVTFNATATDSDGSVSKVEFFQGKTKLGEDTSAPYSYEWTGVAAGKYSLTAIATDNEGGTKTSAISIITVYKNTNLTGVYKLTAQCSNKSLEVTNSGTTNGANVRQWTYGGGNNQKWIIEKQSDGDYKLTAQHSGKCLNVSGAATTNGANVVQWADNGKNEQRWNIYDLGSGYYKLISKCNGKALNVSNAETVDGANVNCWTDNGKTSQKWKIELLSDPVSNQDVLLNDKITAVVYPIPASDFVTVSCVQEIANIRITNTLGQTIKEVTASTTSELIDISDLKNGLYFVNFETSTGKEYVEKLVVRK